MSQMKLLEVCFFLGEDFAAHPHYVTIVIHYCKGGLESDENSALMGTDCQPTPDLYVADEAAGGVLFLGEDFAAHPHYVTIVIHYCKGGLESDENSALMGTDCQPTPDLYVADEAAGGVLFFWERTSQRILTMLPSSSTTARVVWSQMRIRR